MILCLDIGNSAIKGALFDGDRLVRTARFEHGDTVALRKLADDAAIRRTAIASVVPRATQTAVEALREISAASPLIVSAEITLPFELAYETPETLGADRIAAAAGALALYPHANPVITVDAGSAVTVEVVAGGQFLGGAIAPGPELLHRALGEGTAQLPFLEPGTTPRVIGRSTEESIRIGVAVPYFSGIRELLRRVRAELGTTPTIVATGGRAHTLAAHIPEIDHVEPHLVLHGVRALVEINA